MSGTTISSSPASTSTSNTTDTSGTVTTIRSSRIVGAAIVIGCIIILLCFILIFLKIATLIQHFGRSRRRAQLQKNSREAGGFDYRDAKRKGGKRGIGGGNAIDAWEWEGSAN